MITHVDLFPDDVIRPDTEDALAEVATVRISNDHGQSVTLHIDDADTASLYAEVFRGVAADLHAGRAERTRGSAA